MEFSNASPGLDAQGALVNRFLFRALYRLDKTFAPEPDLAAKPCDVAADQVTITCTLGNATFSDGSPITAEDVAFTYQIAISGACPFEQYIYCGNPILEKVEAAPAGSKTVRFRLRAPDAPFFTTVLPAVWIDSKRRIMNAYDAFIAKAGPIGKDTFAKAGDTMDGELNRTTPNCQPLIAPAVALISRGGLTAPSESLWKDESGANFDACGYAAYLRGMLGDMHYALVYQGIVSVAIIYRSLSPETPPSVTSGRWAVSSFDPGKSLTLEAAPGSVAATRRFVFRFFSDRRVAIEQAKAGAVDWVEIPGFQLAQGSADLVRLARADGRLQIAHFPIPGVFTMIDYNVRPGQVMADATIRNAVDLCLDKPTPVEDATAGIAATAWSDVAPGTWAAAVDLPQLPRDVASANALIAHAGWTMGPDGFYHKSGQRLGISVLVAEASTIRQRFLGLAALQLKDCGFNLTLDPEVPGGPTGINAAVCRWPLIFTGETRPFEAVMFSTIAYADPWGQADFDGRSVISRGHDCFSGGYTNSSGYQNAEFDSLLAKVRQTYDTAQRVQYYKRMQEILASDHAALFAWFNEAYEVLSPGLRTTEGPIDLTSAGWNANLEALVKNLRQ